MTANKDESMKVITSGLIKLIRDHVAEYYPEPSHETGLLLLTCAITIERLVRERDEALGQARK